VLLRLSIRRGLIKVVVAAHLLAFYHNVTEVQFLKASTFASKKCDCLTMMMMYTRILGDVAD
jgi:hypothetical protein